MDVYEQITNSFLGMPYLDAWSELSVLFKRIASGKPSHWMLPILACEAVGGTLDQAIPAAVAIACSHISIIIVDDMLDSDPRGEYLRIGNGRAANFAIALQAASMDALIGSKASPSVRLELLYSLNKMMLTTAHGQDLDIQNPADETSYWQVVENKSAPFFGCALHLGALFGKAPGDIAKNLKRLGQLYGEMIQIHDDLNYTMAMPANSDWLQGRRPLPILFALSVDHPGRTRFMELYQNISAENALQEAQEILIRCGAMSYCVDQLLRRHQTAQDILNKTLLPNKERVDSLMQAVVAPVWKLFETLGIARSALVGS